LKGSVQLNEDLKPVIDNALTKTMDIVGLCRLARLSGSMAGSITSFKASIQVEKEALFRFTSSLKATDLSN
jgi:hypothetical protein